jgi:hypothetical protein
MNYRINQLLFILLLTAGVMSCDNNKKSASKDLENYVDSIDKANPDYSVQNWQAIENGYNERIARAESESAEMSEKDKKQLDDSRKKYNDLKAKYDAELQQRNIINSKIALRNSLFGEGKVGDDMNFYFVTGANALSVYQSFVDAVEANKDKYSREDWDEIKVLYEALDAHKNSIEKDLSGEDNRKIAELKIKMSAKYAGYRPGSKATENEEAKE